MQSYAMSAWSWSSSAFVVALLLSHALGTASATAEPGSVISYQKINEIEGDFAGILDDFDEFGRSAAALGDLDGDGVSDFAVGAYLDDDGGEDRGAVWVLFMNGNGTVKASQKISDVEGGFTGELSDSDLFGISVADLGDLDGDGVRDLAVGAARDDDGGFESNRGAVWVLFMNRDGTVKGHQKISDTQGGVTPVLQHEDLFGISVAGLGDLDGDGVPDLAVGEYLDDDGGVGLLAQRGAVWILLMNTNGTVKNIKKISDTQGGFTGVLDDGDGFGFSVATTGDLDGDGVPDVAVGAGGDDDGGTWINANRGAVWLLFLNSNGTVKAHQKISGSEGGFTGVLDDFDQFGTSIASLGDIDGNGVDDLAVGANLDDDGGSDRGAVWVLFMNSDVTVTSHQKISDTGGSFVGVLDDLDYFGISVAAPGDLDGDGVVDLAVGAWGDDDSGSARGAVWVLFLDGVPSTPADLNGDGVVNGFDLALLLGAWGPCPPRPQCPADLDGNGIVNGFDLAILLGAWG